MLEPVIVNVVATASLSQQLDFYELRKLKEVLHDSEIYGGRVAYFKASNMRGKISLFPSGKMISVGTTSEKESFYELEYVKNFLIKKKMIEPIHLQPKIQNIVATVDLGNSVKLEELSISFRMIYEPEQFPAGILKIKEPYQATILIFHSGKAVITGVKNSKQVNSVAQKLEKIMRSELAL